MRPPARGRLHDDAGVSTNVSTSTVNVVAAGEIGASTGSSRFTDFACRTLDIVVANAGVFLRKPLTESSEDDYEYLFNTNTKGVFFTLREAGKRVNDGGRIVAVSSGGTKMPFADASLYLGSKGAIEQFVRSLSRELGPRFITVNVLSPGFTETDMLPDDQTRALGASLSPFNRVGTSEEVADVAAFLASEAARWVTGQNVQAGGGVV